MLVNVFYRKEFGRVEPRDVRSGDYDYVCDVRHVTIGNLSALEETFREMNAVDGTETCCKLRVRSMSTGDVARTDDGVFLCASMGWEKLGGDAAAGFDARAQAGDFKSDDGCCAGCDTCGTHCVPDCPSGNGTECTVSA